MVALHHSFERPRPTDATRARDDVDRLGAGLSRALLAMPADTVRGIAARAADASAAAARRRERVGERPALDEGVSAEVVAAESAYRAARAGHAVSLRERHRLLAYGNAAGLLSIAAGVGAARFGLSVTSLPVAAAMLGAAAGPSLAALVGASRCSATSGCAADARGRWAAALESAGLHTMGAFAARRLAVEAWERRCHEAEATEQAARSQLWAWHLLAGPGVPPDDVEVVLARVAALRRAQLRLLAALLAELPNRPASVDREPVTQLLRNPFLDDDDLDAPVDAAAGTAWFNDPFERIRGRKLRLFGG